jgi:NAD(P)-dependent dehydrogenase (short-subunit alcohol dehydrogenase family)
MRAALDKRQFGPWALVTGASSGIGKEFARQIAAAGINVSFRQACARKARSLFLSSLLSGGLVSTSLQRR